MSASACRTTWAISSSESGLEREDAGAGEERGDDLERRVLGRRADERDGAVLDVGEDGVLLGLVEAVDLVDEEDGAEVLGGAYLAGLLDRLPEVGDAGGDGGDADEVRLREAGDEPRERRLAGAGRAPEHHGGHLAGADGALQHVALAEEVALPDVLLERAGAHAGRERGVLVLVLSPHVLEEGLFLPHAALCHGGPSGYTYSPQGEGITHPHPTLAGLEAAHGEAPLFVLDLVVVVDEEEGGVGVLARCS